MCGSVFLGNTFHEAGYDAYVTGYAFAQLAYNDHYYLHSVNNPTTQDDTEQKQTADEVTLPAEPEPVRVSLLVKPLRPYRRESAPAPASAVIDPPSVLAATSAVDSDISESLTGSEIKQNNQNFELDVGLIKPYMNYVPLFRSMFAIHFGLTHAFAERAPDSKLLGERDKESEGSENDDAWVYQGVVYFVGGFGEACTTTVALITLITLITHHSRICTLTRFI